MPVDLTLLPDELPKQKKCNWWFWVILLIVFIILGAVVTFVLSFFYAISNLLFILGAIMLPVSLWIFSALYGLYHRGYQESYINNWNIARNERRNQLIAFARRGLYVLHYSLNTEYGEGSNAKGVSSNQYAISAKLPHSGGTPIPHSALSLPDNTHSGSFYERLLAQFTRWQTTLQPLVAQLPAICPIHVRLFIESPLKHQDLERLWAKTLGKIIRVSSFSVEPVDNSNAFMEQWLDNSDHDHELLLVISAHLFSSPAKNEAEFVSLLLLVGEQLIAAPEFAAFIDKPLAKVYRTEQTPEMPLTIDNTLLWGNEDNKSYDGVWYSGVTTALNVEIMNYFNEIKFTSKGIFNIDTSIGYAGQTAYWLALVLAIEQSLETKNKQLIVIGKPEVTASVVTIGELSKESSNQIRE